MVTATVAIALVGPVRPVDAIQSSPAAIRAARRGLAWLHSQQKADGSLAENVSLTAELVLAVRAAGMNPNTFSTPSPVTYLRSHVARAVALGVGVVGKVVLAVDAARANPSSFGGKDLLEGIRSKGKRGQYDKQIFNQSFAMLALRASGVPAPESSFLQVLKGQDPSGGWGISGLPGNPDTNSTAIAMQALQSTVGPISRSPLSTVSLLRAIRYLHLEQNGDAAFPYQRVSSNCSTICASDPNSTAYVTQALVAAGQNVEGRAWRKDTRDPIVALIAMQGPSGAFTGFSAVLATVQAVPGILGKSFLCIAAAIGC